MLALINKFSRYIFSDSSGLKVKRLAPLQAGERIPSFHLFADHGVWVDGFVYDQLYSNIPVKLLLQKPLVVLFYSPHWNHLGREFINEVRENLVKIRDEGANVLVISSHRKTDILSGSSEFGLLNIYYDEENEIASSFGVYNEENPVWNRFSGIDINIPLLSVYIIAPSRDIVYDYIEGQMGNFSGRAILTAIKQAREVY